MRGKSQSIINELVEASKKLSIEVQSIIRKPIEVAYPDKMPLETFIKKFDPQNGWLKRGTIQ